MKQKSTLLMMLLLAASFGWAQPNGTGTYYQSANGNKGQSLKTALYEIIKSPSVQAYSQLFECYKSTDLRPDGKIWDMYSNTTNFDPDNDHSGNYSAEGDMFNREHSFPKSWFSDASPMNSDLFHVIPTDGYVNNRRGNYPFGETKGETYMSNGGFSKVGTSTISGYTGTVFEPNDEYKGDFARIYFYMVTCYEDKVASWNCDILAKNTYPAYVQWAIDMLLRWAKDDPVSQKEIDRNNAVYKIQGNRNPYVDYPGLEQYVWGSKTDVAFSYDDYDSTVTPDPDPEPDPEPTPDPEPVDGKQNYVKVTGNDGLQIGAHYLLVYESDAEGKALADMISSGKAFNYASVAIDNGKITTNVNSDGLPHELTLGGEAGSYTIYDTKLNAYLSLPSSDNALKTAETATGANEEWTISISDGYAEIRNNGHATRTIRYNAGYPRFACYTSGQEPVSLYKLNVSSSIDILDADEPSRCSVIYSIDGRRVGTTKNGDTATDGLQRGVYIIGGKKLLVK
ncbi:MAG: endonuclease [Prevotella sp.]